MIYKSIEIWKHTDAMHKQFIWIDSKARIRFLTKRRRYNSHPCIINSM